jgi:predicted dinucleotide-binding enzyme
MGTRAPDDLAVIERLSDLPGISLMAHRDAVKAAELAIFAIPFDGLIAVAGEIAGTLTPGITLIDATDPNSEDPTDGQY